MRDAFFQELQARYRDDPRTMFITGDLGYKLFDPLIEIDAGRTINIGIREAAMVGLAAGLAKTGLRPYVYSIVPFLTLRALEQIKLDCCYNRVPVVLVGVGGGYAYGPNGPTHHGTDDLATLGALPGMQVWTPAGPNEVRAFMRTAPSLDGPAYLRLGRNGEPDAPRPNGSVAVDAPVLVRAGTEGTLVTCGVLLHEVLEAAAKLASEGIDASVVHLPTFKPFPGPALLRMLPKGAPVLTLEEHVASGGLGHHTARLLAENRWGGAFVSATLPDQFPETCLSRPAALKWAGLDAKSIAARFHELKARG